MARNTRATTRKAAPESEFYSPQEVAALLNVPLRTIRHWRTVNYGPEGRRFGGRLRYPRGEVDKFATDPEGYQR